MARPLRPAPAQHLAAVLAPAGRPFPKGTPTFPSRDDVVAHLDRLAAEDGIAFELGTVVERVARENGGWVVRTSAGDVGAPAVVVATGYEGGR